MQPLPVELRPSRLPDTLSGPAVARGGYLLEMTEAERRDFGRAAPDTIPVIVHPFYNHVKRILPADGAGISVPYVREGADAYSGHYRSMPRADLDAYPNQLLALAKASTHAILFEEGDRILITRMLLPELPWDDMLIVPTNRGNSGPLGAAPDQQFGRWHPELWTAIEQIGRKNYVVHGGGFQPIPKLACAGAVLVFLASMAADNAIGSARPGTTAVLRE